MIRQETMRINSHQENRGLRVAAYIRISTDSSDQENSYEIQEQHFRGMLSGNPDWMPAGIYSDYGISGTDREKRTGFRRMLRHCGEGKIDRIFCKSISRFARNTADFMIVLKILKEHHVTVYFEKECLDTSSEASTFILTTLGAIAQEESRSISDNIRWKPMWRTIAGVVLLKKECNGVLGRRTERRKRDGETNREEGKQESRWGGEGKGKEREKEKGRNAGRRNEQGRR